MTGRPFNPAYGTGQSVTAGASAAITVNGPDQQVCITNTGGAVAYVRIGAAAAGLTASATDYPIPPGAQVVISKGFEQTGVAYFCATSTTLHIMTGNGF